MLRKFVCAVAIVALSLSVAMAEEFFGSIKKIDGDKITVTKGAKKGEKGTDVTLDLAKDVKVTTGGKFNKETKKVDGAEAVADGLKTERLTKIGEKGTLAIITTDADGKKVTGIHLVGGGKKKDAQ